MKYINGLRLAVLSFGLVTVGWFTNLSKVWAYPFADMTTVAMEGTVEKDEPSLEAAKVRYLSERFNVTREKIRTFRDKNMDWGDITYLLVISSKSGQTVDSVLALKERGDMSWGEISQKYNLLLGDVYKDVRTVTEELNTLK